jgi:hypothetical protein
MAELFTNFEVNRASRWQILLKLLGGSVVLHVILLSTAIYVPALRDAFNIAALVASTRFVDKDYKRTEIANDVELLTLTAEKFRYPAGYWLIAEENPAAALVAAAPPPVDPFAPKIISQASSGMGFEPESSASPSASPSPSPAASPSPGASASPSPSASPQIAQNAGEPTKEELARREEAQKKLEETAKENNLALPTENEINKKALKDFAAYANERKKEGKLNLDQPFEIVIQAQMDDKGKLLNPKFTKTAGDENLVDLFGRMVGALNDSGFLTYLQPISKDNPGSTIIITIKQGENEVLATVESEAASPDRARNLAKVLNTMLVFGAGSRAGKDEEVLMKNTSVAPDGKKVIVKLTMPRQTVVEMLQKQLEPGV